jgi:hypothetical protein
VRKKSKSERNEGKENYSRREGVCPLGFFDLSYVFVVKFGLERGKELLKPTNRIKRWRINC